MELLFGGPRSDGGYEVFSRGCDPKVKKSGFWSPLPHPSGGDPRLLKVVTVFGHFGRFSTILGDLEQKPVKTSEKQGATREHVWVGREGVGVHPPTRTW